jgi:monofunctional biosynthetic peptidoglycan transglycosylase
MQWQSSSKAAPIEVGGTIVHGTGFVNSTLVPRTQRSAPRFGGVKDAAPRPGHSSIADIGKFIALKSTTISRTHQRIAYRSGTESPPLRIVRNLFLIALFILLLPYLVAPLYRVGHPVSTLMAWRWLRGAPVSRQWVDLAAMSPALPRSVVASEDAKFCSHRGIDWDALRDVIDDAEDGEVARGGSTITQQVAKNLFLWQGRSLVRKALEFPLALWIDLVLPKQRILEIYLNIAELGPSGQFGAQAGSTYAFGRPASSLSPREAALLAAILPNPVARSARNPGPRVHRLAATYMVRAQATGLRRCWAENRGF